MAIVDVVELAESLGLALEKSGSGYKGLCPFHAEKTPSFHVDPKRNLYTCFGACGQTWNPVQFVMKLQDMDKGAAYGVLKSFGATSERDFGNYFGFVERQVLFEATNAAQQFFVESLDHFDMRKLYHKRGITDETIEKFGFGYAPKKGFIERFVRLPISRDTLQKASLLLPNSHVSFMRNRLTIPFTNTREQVMGFAGRAITKKDEDSAKYINTANTPIFQKRDELYLLSFARPHIVEKEFCILVEGHFDVAMSHQHGIQNTVGTNGTAFTVEHGYQLRNFPYVVLALDGDMAGIKAAIKTAGNLIRAGTNLGLAVFPLDDKGKGHDPDSFIRQYGVDEYLKLIGKAKPYFEAFVDFLQVRNDINSTAGRLVIGKELMSVASMASDPFEQATYIKYISKLTDIPTDLLLDAAIYLREKPSTYELLDSIQIYNSTQSAQEQLISSRSQLNKLSKSVQKEILTLVTHPDVKKVLEWELNKSKKEQLDFGFPPVLDDPFIAALLNKDEESADLTDVIKTLRKAKKERDIQSLSNIIIDTPVHDSSLGEHLETLRQLLSR